jgi:isoprenylcysteine carboxyl methyltransferase (ICMT) family protein YpbQ
MEFWGNKGEKVESCLKMVEWLKEIIFAVFLFFNFILLILLHSIRKKWNIKI